MSAADLNNLPISDIKKLVKENKKLKGDKQKQQLIEAYLKIKKQNAKSRKEKTNPKPKKKKPKTFEKYFQECTKNKTIPADTPSYLKKALERALKEYQQGTKKEESALDNFAKKFTIDGEAKVIPIQYFENKSTKSKDSFRNHPNIKNRLVLVCLMEKKDAEKIKVSFFYSRQSLFSIRN